MIEQLPYLENHQILIQFYDGTTTDITSYILELAAQWFRDNNFHVNKSLLPDEIQALTYIEDKEPLDFVERFYKIQKKDYTPTASEKEMNNGLYKIRPPQQD
ncbi:TPA: hypothetical protein TXT63_001294 [Streptococcus suis]|nr:hypothetical protein [Streptococcus suis]